MPPNQSDSSFRDVALEIWNAGVAAVDSRRLVTNAVSVARQGLLICDQHVHLSDESRICVVGGGKAGAGMVLGFEDVLRGTRFESQVSGWVNVPADCLVQTDSVQLHAARPPGLNEPCREGVEGTERILQMASRLTAEDLCVVLLSGGGSALLPAPVSGVTLDQKQRITRHLMQSGATIGELNSIRKRISRLKGGGLARSTNAGHRHSLIISDVIGDPLDVIASGPTVDDPVHQDEVIRIAETFGLDKVVAGIGRILSAEDTTQLACKDFQNHIIGSNRIALEASSRRAVELGFEVHSLGSDNNGVARIEGVAFAEKMLQIAAQADRPTCLISGGEPIVHLSQTDRPRKGGRNQEFVLAAARCLVDQSSIPGCLLAGGTDGEDGPTDAAGAVIDTDSLRLLREHAVDIDGHLEINNSYEPLDKIGSLIRTGPTHTNVMDLRIALVNPEHARSRV